MYTSLLFIGLQRFKVQRFRGNQWYGFDKGSPLIIRIRSVGVSIYHHEFSREGQAVIENDLITLNGEDYIFVRSVSVPRQRKVFIKGLEYLCIIDVGHAPRSELITILQRWAIIQD